MSLDKGSKMQFTDMQDKALNMMVRPKRGVTYVKGYGGAGKTTVMAAAAKELGHRCIVLAPTNKAAINLRKKGIDTAQTIHSFLYIPAPMDVYKKDAKGEVVFQKNPDGSIAMDDDGPIAVVASTSLGFSIKEVEKLPAIALIDEASMIGGKIYLDLCRVFAHVIFCGDDFQLMPVNDDDWFFKVEADITMTEVHRIAIENPVMRYATDIRNMREPDIMSVLCDKIQLKKSNDKELFAKIVEEDFQSICFTNKTRHKINENIRKRKGYEPYTLMDNEELVCLKSFRDTDADGESRLLFYNGQMLNNVGEYKGSNDHFNTTYVQFKQFKNAFPTFPFWNERFFDLYDGKDHAWYNAWNLRKGQTPRPIFGTNLDYAYCLTAHKAQGSEFEKVAAFDQRVNFPPMWTDLMKARWWYTVVTRTKDELLVVRK